MTRSMSFVQRFAVNQQTQPTGNNEPQNGEICIANISPAERRKRLTLGIVSFALSLAVLAFLMAIGANRWLRLSLFILFSIATSGYFQWQAKTCVALAVRDLRQLGDSAEKIEDADELAQVRKQARRVQFKASLAALILTLIALVLPA